MIRLSSPSPSPTASQVIANECHPNCCVCSTENPAGLAVRYVVQPDGSVAAAYQGDRAREGYPGFMHGGIIAALLDGAMTHCLLARGIPAMTVELKVRYRGGVEVDAEAMLRARVVGQRHRVYQLEAELKQGDELKASAAGKFTVRTPGRV